MKFKLHLCKYVHADGEVEYTLHEHDTSHDDIFIREFEIDVDIPKKYIVKFNAMVEANSEEEAISNLNKMNLVCKIEEVE